MGDHESTSTLPGSRTAAVGVITLTRQLDAVPWISPEYFAARYPEQWARNAVYYLGIRAWPGPSPGVQRSWRRSPESWSQPMVAERAVIAYDMCSYNNHVLGFSRMNCGDVQTLFQYPTTGTRHQVYYGVDFA